jgi:hypothetical protein
MQRCDAFCPYLTFVYGIATTSRTKLFVWAIWGSGGGVVVGGGGRGVGGVGIGEGGGAVGICTDRLVSFVCMLDNMRIPRHCTRSSHTSTKQTALRTRKRTLQASGPEYIGKSTTPCGTHSRPGLLCNCNTLLHRHVRTE